MRNVCLFLCLLMLGCLLSIPAHAADSDVSVAAIAGRPAAVVHEDALRLDVSAIAVRAVDVAADSCPALDLQAISPQRRVPAVAARPRPPAATKPKPPTQARYEWRYVCNRGVCTLQQVLVE